MSNAESIYGGAAPRNPHSAAHKGARNPLSAAPNPLSAAPNPLSAAHWARPVLIALTAVCGLVLLARFVAEPLMTIRHVTVHSDVPLADDQVLVLSGIQGGEHWYTVSASAIEKRLEASPLVRRAQAEKVFPDTIRLTLWGRQPAALVLATADGRSFPVLVDEEGVVFKVGSTSADLDLPVVSGLAVGDMALGRPAAAQLPRPVRRPSRAQGKGAGDVRRCFRGESRDAGFHVGALAAGPGAPRVSHLLTGARSRAGVR